MAFLGYTIKVPEAALMSKKKRFVDVLWVTRLGKYEDDINLRGVTVHKIAEGWRYEVRSPKGKVLEIKELNGGLQKGKDPIFRYRPVREGDYYVKFADGTYDVMNTRLLSWYRRKYAEQLKREIDNDEKAQEVLQILNQNQQQ